MNCSECGSLNRPAAKYCKRCGALLANSSPASTADLDSLIDELVGLDEIKAELRRLNAVASQLARLPMPGRGLNFHTLILGNAGTGKTKICNILAAIWRAHDLIKGATTVEAADYQQKFAKDFDQNFQKAKGSMLVLNDVQKLVPAGYSQELDPLDKLLTAMRTSNGDPIVVLTGLPKGFREYLDKNPRVKGLFSIVFELPDMGVDQLARVCQKELLARGFSLSDEARTRLAARFRYLVKHKDETFDNGHLALRVAQEIVTHYLVRLGAGATPDLTILPEDIKGHVMEEKSLEQVLQSLDDLIGMEQLKKEIRDLATMLQVQKQREELEGRSFRPILHIVLTGNPGTGKTTVARTLGEIFEAMKLLDPGHVVEVDRKGLVAGYVGQTAIQVNQKVDEAMGGILFIDEAYTLKQDDNDTFGQEAINALLKRMEDDRGKFVVVAAGYEHDMQRFLDANPGLRSRFTHYFQLPDYGPEELCEIFKVFARKEGYHLDPPAEAKVKRVLKERYLVRDRNFANAREVRTLFERSVKNQAKRISLILSQKPEELSTLRAEDIPDAVDERFGSGISLEEAWAKLEALIGLQQVKEEVRRLANYLKAEKARAAAGGKPYLLSVHFVFAGNPGTGKTTVARLLGDIFRSIGLLPSGHVVEVDRKDLVAEYQGQTAPKTSRAIDRALGGILFVDEAYTLARDSFGQEAIDTLMKRMEDERGKFVVIVAGYEDELRSFLQANPGLAGRFTKHIHFADYNAQEMTKIFLFLAAERGIVLAEGVEERVRNLMEQQVLRKDRSFANGRTVRTIFERVLERQAERISSLLGERDLGPQVLNTITLEDVEGISV
jgi:SpoVK/Ycf46/Vps4 family AAA+-type ATPase